MSAGARAHLDAALAAGEKELAVRAHLLAHPELDEDAKVSLRALCRELDAENERQTELWFEARVASGFAADTPTRTGTAPRRDVDDVDDWNGPTEVLL